MRTLAEFRVHPTADLFPLIEGQDFDELKESIKRNGLIDSVVVDGDELIDGRNRLRACEALGVEPRFLEWSSLGEAKTKSEWILAKNVTRRHLDEGQRATAWALGQKNALAERREEKKKATQFKPGDPRQNPGGRPNPVARTDSYEPVRDYASENARSTVGQVSNGASVSHHVAAQAVAVANADEQLAAEVVSGKTKLPEAAKRVAASKPKKPRKKKPLKDRVDSWLSGAFRKKFSGDKKADVIKCILEALQ